MPKWKVEWVRSNLDAMIRKDDTGRRPTLKSRKSTLKKKKTKAVIEEVAEDEEMDMS